MTTPSRIYTDNTGGRRRLDAKRTDFYERFASNAVGGPHMPLDLDIHWQWSNPLNIFPAFALLLAIIAAVALIVG